MNPTPRVDGKAAGLVENPGCGYEAMRNVIRYRAQSILTTVGNPGPLLPIEQAEDVVAWHTAHLQRAAAQRLAPGWASIEFPDRTASPLHRRMRAAMLKPHQLSPLYRRLLEHVGPKPGAAMLRGKGGYATVRGGTPSFTTRTVNAMHRDYLVELVGPFRDEVRLTPPGRALAQQLADAAEQAEAA